MTLTPDFSFFTEAFTTTMTLGTRWLIPLALTMVTLALITKDMEKWKILAFPVMVLQRIIGIPVHPLLLIFVSIMFVVEALSTQVIGNIIGTAKKWQGKEYDREWAKANKLLGRAKTQEIRNAQIGKAKKEGLMKSGITKLLDRSRRREERRLRKLERELR